jgi:hypothetical protein
MRVSASQSAPPPTQTPVPKPAPFPGANAPAPPGAKPAPGVVPPSAPQQDGAALDPRLAGVPIYPGAELLSSFDTGRGQQVFLLGSSMPYSDIVGFYKLQLRNNGSEVFKTPPMQQFDLGQFRSETMAYRPSVVVKDYTWMDSPGYLHVAGTIEKRFRTVIQIVPATR